AWPPAGAEAVGLDFVYDRLSEQGLGYGPSFQGLRAAWRRGEELFAEVALGGPEADEAERFGLHPALFDAAFHALLLTAGEAEPASANGSPPRVAVLGDGIELEVERYLDVDALVADLVADAEAPDVVLVRAGAAEPGDSSVETAAAAREECGRMLALLKAWL